MDNTKSFYLLNMGSIPVGRTSYNSGFSEMDIISVFETDGVGSIPYKPGHIILKIFHKHVDTQRDMLYNSHILSN